MGIKRKVIDMLLNVQNYKLKFGVNLNRTKSQFSHPISRHDLTEDKICFTGRYSQQTKSIVNSFQKILETRKKIKYTMGLKEIKINRIEKGIKVEKTDYGTHEVHGYHLHDDGNIYGGEAFPGENVNYNKKADEDEIVVILNYLNELLTHFV